jgi:lactoylglutathione lyase
MSCENALRLATHPVTAILAKKPVGIGYQRKRSNDLAKTIHCMIRVLEEARSVDFYARAFGLAVADRVEFDTFTLIYLSNGETGFELELTVNKDRTEAYQLGDGYGHLAFSVDDLDAEHQRFVALGLNPGRLVDMDHRGEALARFFFVSDPDGYKIEVVKRAGRYL